MKDSKDIKTADLFAAPKLSAADKQKRYRDKKRGRPASSLGRPKILKSYADGDVLSRELFDTSIQSCVNWAHTANGLTPFERSHVIHVLMRLYVSLDCDIAASGIHWNSPKGL